MNIKPLPLVLTILTVVAAIMAFSLATFAATASPTASTVLVDGNEVAFDAYKIADNNYFKLRDLAFTLSGTAKQFDVGWDGANNAISLTSGQSYTIAGGEMSGKGGGAKEAATTDSRIFLDGREVRFTAYNIDGNNYFKLRDIGEAFNFGVDWDDTRDTVGIDTSKGYSTGGGEVSVNLTPQSARLALQEWVESHPFQLGSELDSESSGYSENGVAYYLFQLDIIRLGTAEILVSEENGELFHLSSPYNETGFEPIDDWYNREHAANAPTVSAENARMIYDNWLVQHAELSDYTLSREPNRIYEADGDIYYLFSADNMEWYWYNILVHIETGELMLYMTPDGEDPVSTIEPLEDWYNEYY